MSRVTSPIAIVLAVLAAAAGAAGCGSGDGSGTSPEAGAATGTSGKSDAVQVIELGHRYIEGITTGDWQEVCQTRTDAEQERAKQASGDCAATFEKAFSSNPGVGDVLKGAQPQSVELNGDRATFSIGSSKRALPGRLHAIKENGEWRLFDPQGSAAP
jgi:hypothetical protein